METTTPHHTRHDSREDLLKAARELIVGRSYGAVGIAEICARAGVRKGSLYHFFPGKEALTLAMLDALYADFEREVLIPGLAGADGLHARIEAFVRAIHAFEARIQAESGQLPGCPFGNLAVEMGTHHPTLRQAIRGHLDAVTAHFRSVLDEAVQDGELPPHTDTDALAEQWLALMEGILVMAKADQDPATILRLGPALGAVLNPSPEARHES
ncbi:MULTISPECIES: TetR/AcrR family transcriptional regulator [unclassified Thioalkalivibrio]|uniref:TetR/AcrR family transcriptional regulator n=1 Tax=unclassified Thioalkalivibrio TaxID=2621013 RepID=UPI00035D3F1F|nr:MULTISPECIES: TetR/AcrR family transcriptional regulator [unclassified Thioalkalivibrio]